MNEIESRRHRAWLYYTALAVTHRQRHPRRGAKASAPRVAPRAYAHGSSPGGLTAAHWRPASNPFTCKPDRRREGRKAIPTRSVPSAAQPAGRLSFRPGRGRSRRSILSDRNACETRPPRGKDAASTAQSPAAGALDPALRVCAGTADAAVEERGEVATSTRRR